nr:16S rRNA (guanine(527)-N(7))-methyltransferase RsmG [Maliibacterium massiliense]
MKKAILQGASALGVPLTDAQARAMAAYWEAMARCGINLTAVRDAQEAVTLHFLDALSLLAYHDIPQGARLIDVGTGGGFPAVPLAIARPDLAVTALDATGKKLRFIAERAQALGIGNIACVHARAEEAARKADLREQFDVVCARAVASLPTLMEYLLPFARVGGLVVAYKGPGVAAEMAQGRAASQLLGGGNPHITPVVLPGAAQRHVLVTIAKQKPTPHAYPRAGGKPKSAPLA